MVKKYKNILKNRQDAAQQLLDVIPIQRYKEERWKVVALSSGGLELAYFINLRYQNKIDILLSEPIIAPNNDECELARVSEQEEIVMNENLIHSFDIQ